MFSVYIPTFNKRNTDTSYLLLNFIIKPLCPNPFLLVPDAN